MDMEKLVSLCKRRGFIFQSSEIYGGLNGFWDYGPLGVELKRNVKETWWRDMITGHDDLAVLPGAPEAYEMVGLDCCSIIMHPQVWKCSGHYDLFVDKMVDCRTEGCKGRFRVDHIPTAECPLKPSKHPGEFEKCQLTAPRDFNLMFKTIIGALGGEEDAAYLRPETAQGMFVNFKNVCDSTRVKIPFGIAQMGKSFRNEITPLHVPLPRVRADGDGVLLLSEPIARVVPLLARPADEVVYRFGPVERAAAIARAWQG